MNPLELTGPQFLFFYAVYAVVILWALHFRQSRNEMAPAPDLTQLDAYTAACLRAGAVEVVHVATLALVDRGLLESREPCAVTSPGAQKRVRRPIERAVLDYFRSERVASGALADPTVLRAAHDIETALRSRGLLITEAQRERRSTLMWVGIWMLVGMGTIKLVIALLRQRHNVILLLMFMLFACLVCAFIGHGERTSRGDQTLVQLQALCAGLRGRAASLRLGGDSYDFAMLLGVFGAAALTAADGAIACALFPALKSNAGPGSSHSVGSSCSGGGSCGSSCGGGCGGCGGCGS